VIGGPSAWLGLRGWVISETKDWVVARFWSRDDSGNGVYDVRLPAGFVKIENIETAD
jgi:hypothetical protein